MKLLTKVQIATEKIRIMSLTIKALIKIMRTVAKKTVLLKSII